MFNPNALAPESHVLLEKEQLNIMCLADSSSLLHNMQMLGPIHLLFCNFSYVRRVSLQTNYRNSLIFWRHLIFQIHLVFIEVTPPFMKWWYVDFTVKLPSFSYLQHDLSSSIRAGVESLRSCFNILTLIKSYPDNTVEFHLYLDRPQQSLILTFLSLAFWNISGKIIVRGSCEHHLSCQNAILSSFPSLYFNLWQTKCLVIIIHFQKTNAL